MSMLEIFCSKFSLFLNVGGLPKAWQTFGGFMLVQIRTWLGINQIMLRYFNPIFLLLQLGVRKTLTASSLFTIRQSRLNSIVYT